MHDIDPRGVILRSFESLPWHLTHGWETNFFLPDLDLLPPDEYRNLEERSCGLLYSIVTAALQRFRSGAVFDGIAVVELGGDGE